METVPIICKNDILEVLQYIICNKIINTQAWKWSMKYVFHDKHYVKPIPRVTAAMKSKG